MFFCVLLINTSNTRNNQTNARYEPLRQGTITSQKCGGYLFRLVISISYLLIINQHFGERWSIIYHMNLRSYIIPTYVIYLAVSGPFGRRYPTAHLAHWIYTFAIHCRYHWRYGCVCSCIPPGGFYPRSFFENTLLNPLLWNSGLSYLYVKLSPYAEKVSRVVTGCICVT